MPQIKNCQKPSFDIADSTILSKQKMPLNSPRILEVGSLHPITHWIPLEPLSHLPASRVRSSCSRIRNAIRARTNALSFAQCIWPDPRCAPGSCQGSVQGLVQGASSVGLAAPCCTLNWLGASDFDTEMPPGSSFCGFRFRLRWFHSFGLYKMVSKHQNIPNCPFWSGSNKQFKGCSYHLPQIPLSFAKWVPSH